MLLRKGQGYRVGWNPQAEEYPALVGSDEWAIELTRLEFQEFYHLLRQLTETMNQMETELMDEEKIAIEAERDLLWMEVEGYPHSYSLRLILNNGRRCEGNWREGVATELVVVTQRLIEELRINS
ncbi:MAG: DUF1818 family protein [Xenococcaceae cyanobacterium MO_188.B19]|nr:DUF1818 family protein [Xenococcaceae cyanobacterium MO_188.B19]